MQYASYLAKVDPELEWYVGKCAPLLISSCKYSETCIKRPRFMRLGQKKVVFEQRWIVKPQLGHDELSGP